MLSRESCIFAALASLLFQPLLILVFPSYIYMSVFGFSIQGSSSEDVPVALQCLEEMLKKRRKQVVSRIYHNIEYKCLCEFVVSTGVSIS